MLQVISVVDFARKKNFYDIKEKCQLKNSDAYHLIDAKDKGTDKLE